LPTLPVVNCFQIVSLTYRSQLFDTESDTFNSCELLSDCIFDIPITTTTLATSWMPTLWIAFRLYLWHTDHNFFHKVNRLSYVVNCFQIVSLTYRSQPWSIWLSCHSRCELLSDCIFDIPITTKIIFIILYHQLWIAFRLYLWHTDHNSKHWITTND